MTLNYSAAATQKKTSTVRMCADCREGCGVPDTTINPQKVYMWWLKNKYRVYRVAM